jgi:hypothetical protein
MHTIDGKRKNHNLWFDVGKEFWSLHQGLRARLGIPLSMTRLWLKGGLYGAEAALRRLRCML